MVPITPPAAVMGGGGLVSISGKAGAEASVNTDNMTPKLPGKVRNIKITHFNYQKLNNYTYSRQ
jgi:hypothetical protein